MMGLLNLRITLCGCEPMGSGSDIYYNCEDDWRGFVNAMKKHIPLNDLLSPENVYLADRKNMRRENEDSSLLFFACHI